MVISVCQHEVTKKHGKDRNGNPRKRCLICGKTFTERAKPLGDMRISMKDATLALGMLLEGMSIRSVERLSGLHRDTICDLVLVVGLNCQRFLSRTVVGVQAKDIQCDEIWSFIGMKERQRYSNRMIGDEGHSWTFIAIDRATKLVLTHKVGQRDNTTCEAFLRRLSSAIKGRAQISTDGLGAYTLNVPFMLKGNVDFGQLIKHFQNTKSVGRYSPAKIIKAEKRAMYGNPKPEQICTSHVERFNLTMRMTLRRFTRLTNGHSKSYRHHVAMQALFVAFYNFCRKHETIKKTPAMAAGLSAGQWTLRELIEHAVGE